MFVGFVVVIFKIYYVVIDGVGGVSLLSLFFDFMFEVKFILELCFWKFELLFNEVEMVIWSFMSFVEKFLKFLKLLMEVVIVFFKIGVFI